MVDRETRRRSIVLSTAAGALAAAICALVIVWPPAPALNSDSMSYVGAARSAVADRGWQIPVGWRDADTTATLSHYPPGYSAALALPLRLGASADDAVRIVNGASLVLATALLAAVVAASCGPLAAVAAVAIVLATPSIEMATATAMSETLFAVPLMAVLALMVVRPAQPVVYGFAAAVCVLVRYSGLSMCIAATVWAFLQAPPRRALQLTRSLQAGLPGFAAFALWAAYTRERGATVRRIGVDLHIQHQLAMGAGTVVRWLAPAALGSTVVRGVIALGLVSLLAVALRAALRVASSRRVIAAAAVMGVSYVATVVGARILADTAIPFDDRLWIPCVWLVAAAIGVTIATAAPIGPADLTTRRVGVAIACTLWFIPAVRDDITFRQRLRATGWDMSIAAWRDSPTLAWVRVAGRQSAIFSNNAPAVYFYSGRYSTATPYGTDTAAALAMGHAIDERCGVLIAFRDAWVRGFPGEALASLLRLSSVASFPDGSVWRSPRCTAQTDPGAAR